MKNSMQNNIFFTNNKLNNKSNDKLNNKLNKNNHNPDNSNNDYRSGGSGMYRHSDISKGQLFGIISGTITTLGVIIGLWQSYPDVWIIIAGIVSIAFSDSFSDGLAMYFSQLTSSEKSVAMQVGFKTTLYKILITMSYVIPFIFLSIESAVIINILWGCILVAYASYQINESVVLNLIIVWIVIGLSYTSGNVIKLITDHYRKK
jgi:hypothetical protein